MVGFGPSVSHDAKVANRPKILADGIRLDSRVKVCTLVDIVSNQHTESLQGPGFVYIDVADCVWEFRLSKLESLHAPRTNRGA